jgi:CRISPR-associated protein Cas1
VDYGRPSLALDLMEEFRHPLVDRLTVTLINKGVLKEEDFAPEPQSGSMHMKPDALKVYFQHYERWMVGERVIGPDGKKMGYRRAFLLQAQRLEESLHRASDYVPFRYTIKDGGRDSRASTEDTSPAVIGDTNTITNTNTAS